MVTERDSPTIRVFSQVTDYPAETGRDGYRTVGRVLRALQAQDGRLTEGLKSFIHVFDGKDSVTPPPDGGDNRDGLQDTLDLGRFKATASTPAWPQLLDSAAPASSKPKRSAES